MHRPQATIPDFISLAWTWLLTSGLKYSTAAYTSTGRLTGVPNLTCASRAVWHERGMRSFQTGKGQAPRTPLPNGTTPRARSPGRPGTAGGTSKQLLQSHGTQKATCTIQLHFYMLAMNNQKVKSRNNFIYNSIEKNTILRNKVIKGDKTCTLL